MRYSLKMKFQVSLLVEIEQDCNSKISNDITQELLSEEQSDLDAFDVHENDCMIYSTSLNQQQETTVTKKQVNIHSYLEIVRDVANKQELNEKQHLFLFDCASHLDSIQNEETLPGCPKSGSNLLTLISELIKKQKQLLLYTDREE